MQNSLERLLAGVAAALREDIAPALEDEYARGQALAGAEILENLVPRVQWRADDAEPQPTGTDALDAALAQLEREVEHLKAAREVARRGAP